MDIENAKREFTRYVENYKYLNNEKVERKYWHSLRVMEAAGNIAKSLNLTDEEIELAKLIGLLHDIGRFEQIKRYNTFSDLLSIDHGDLGTQILQESNYIRKYIESNNYDSIILKAIKNHNKLKIEDGLSSKEMLFAKITRDADKIDIFYEGVEMFWVNQKERDIVGKSDFTKEVVNDFNNHYIINRKNMKTDADDILSFIALIYDIYFKYDFIILKKEDYINRIMNKFKFEKEETQKQLEEIKKVANEFIDEKLK